MRLTGEKAEAVSGTDSEVEVEEREAQEALQEVREEALERAWTQTSVRCERNNTHTKYTSQNQIVCVWGGASCNGFSLTNSSKAAPRAWSRRRRPGRMSQTQNAAPDGTS